MINFQIFFDKDKEDLEEDENRSKRGKDSGKNYKNNSRRAKY